MISLERRRRVDVLRAFCPAPNQDDFGLGLTGAVLRDLYVESAQPVRQRAMERVSNQNQQRNPPWLD
jgi:hypothetical protein